MKKLIGLDRKQHKINQIWYPNIRFDNLRVLYQIGVSTSQVCAQPALDLTISSGEDFNPQPTRMQFQIKRVRSYRISGFPRSVLGFPISPVLAKIWLDLTRFGRYSFVSMEIWPRSGRDLKGFGRVRVELTGVWVDLG